MWVVTAALLLAAPAAEVADQPSAHADGSLLPDHQQLIADRVSTPALDKLLAEPKKNSSKGVVHSAIWEAKYGTKQAEPPKTTRHSAIWEAKHSGTKTSSSSKVDLRKTKSKDDEPEDHEDQGEQEEHEGHDEHKEPKQQEQQGQQGEQEGEFNDDKHKAINVVVSVMLFASLTFIMSLFYLVNYPDPQIRAQAWRAVSQTIVIFVSVLVFNASNGFVTWREDYSMPDTLDSLRVVPVARQHDAMPDTGDFFLAMAQLTFWILAFQFTVSVCAGVVFWNPDKWITGPKKAVDSPPLKEKDRSGAGEEKEEEKGEEQAEEKEGKKTPTADELEIATTASAMILGHVAGFAGINAFGVLMQLSPFADNFGLCLLAWLIAVVSIVGMVVGSEYLRDMCLRKLKGDWYESNLLHAKLHLLDHQAHHGGNDVIALVTSFLLIQLLRFGITGNLPDLYGGETTTQVESHTALQCWSLVIFALIGACFAGAGYFIRRNVSALPVRRLLLTFQLSMAMTKSWCFFFSGVWIIGSTGVAHVLEVSEESALLDVLLALALSGYAFFLIFVLDKLADADWTGPDADAFIYTFMGGLGILIGFAWEQAFERSLETVVEGAEDAHVHYPEPLLKALLASFIVILVLPAWRIWILRTTLQAQKEGGMEFVGE